MCFKTCREDFRTRHLEQVAMELGMGLELRRKPSDGGIVERPFGTFNTQFFSALPGYVNSNVTERSPAAETEGCLTLVQLEQLLVRYIVDNYNQGIDARMGDQSRMGRWEAGRALPLRLMGDRELDVCLMRRERRAVYRNGYIQFANLTYLGEHLAAYAGESVIVRYNPRDITTIYIYQIQDSKEVFLTRAHAQGWETEILSYAEAQALSQRRREAGKAISNRAMLAEVRDRDERIKKLQKQQKQNESAIANPNPITPDAPTHSPPSKSPTPEPVVPPESETIQPKKPVPYVRVYETGGRLTVTLNETEIIVPSQHKIDAAARAHIERLQRQCIVELELVQRFHAWLDDKRHCRQACRVIGDSRTGKTFACNAYRLKASLNQTNGDAPSSPSFTGMPPPRRVSGNCLSDCWSI